MERLVERLRNFMFGTNFYHKGNHIRTELPLRLVDFVKLKRLVAGQLITIGDVSKEGTTTNVKSFWVGDATPYHKPSCDDGGFGWDYDDPIMEKTIIEVNTY